EVARWLARLHLGLAAGARHLDSAVGLLRYDADFYRLWPRRALAFLGQTASREVRRDLRWLGEAYEPVVGRLSALPLTFLHGEFYPSNVLVQETEAGLRVCPIDWEMAAVGPGLIDLAALTAGKWSDEERTTLLRAYHAEWAATGTDAPPWEALRGGFDCCRL